MYVIALFNIGANYKVHIYMTDERKGDKNRWN